MSIHSKYKTSKKIGQYVYNKTQAKQGKARND